MEYGLGIKCSIDILNKKYPMLTKKYKGKGRPRKIDYDYKTITEIQKKLDNIMCQRLDNIWKSK